MYYCNNINILKKIRNNFPCKYLVIARYSPSSTEYYFFKDYIDLENFVIRNFDCDDIDYVVYNLEPYAYNFNEED